MAAPRTSPPACARSSGAIRQTAVEALTPDFQGVLRRCRDASSTAASTCSRRTSRPSAPDTSGARSARGAMSRRSPCWRTPSAPSDVLAKSSLMLGLGETDAEIAAMHGRPARRRRRYADARPVPASDRRITCRSSASCRRRSSCAIASRAWRGLSRVRVGPAGTLELSRGAGAGRQQRRPRRTRGARIRERRNRGPRPAQRHRCGVRWLGTAPTSRPGARCSATPRRAAPTPRTRLWLLEHEPVYTLGMNADPAHVLDAGRNPGGAASIAAGRSPTTARASSSSIRSSTCDARGSACANSSRPSSARSSTWRRAHGIVAAGRPDAPGVYVGERKLASVGLRIRRGGSYHGLALNVAMDLGPFRRINPCGYAGLEMTQLAELGGPSTVDRAVAFELAPLLLARLARRGALSATAPSARPECS